MAKTLADLRAERAEEVDKWNSILFDKDGNVRDDITEDEEKKAAEHEKTVSKLDERIQRAERAQQAKARETEVIGTGKGDGEKPSQPAKPKKDWDFKGQRFARAVQCIALGSLERRPADEVAKSRFGDSAYPIQSAVKTLESGQISPSSGSDVAGGHLVDEDFVDEIIELLRSRSVVMQMNPTRFPMPQGNLTIPGFATGSTAQYEAENANAPKTEPTFRDVNLSAKKLIAVVPVSNSLIRFATVASEQAIRDDLIRAMSEKMDQKFIRGDGTSNTPTGLLNLAPSGNKFNASDISGVTDLSQKVQTVRNDLSKLEGFLEDADIPMDRPGFVLAPRTKRFLMDLITEQGAYAFPEMRDGRLRGKPFMDTTNVPTNLGGSPANDSEIYLADFAHVVVGESSGITVSASDVAAYHDGSNVQAAFSKDQTVMRSIAEHDINLRHPNAVAVMEQVEWGV